MATLECVIRGAAFGGRAAIDALSRLEPGHVVRLVRDASNQHDPNAIGVHYLGVQIGWVPRELNARLAAAMDAGVTATALCTRSADAVASRPRNQKEAMILCSWEDPR